MQTNQNAQGTTVEYRPIPGLRNVVARFETRGSVTQGSTVSISRLSRDERIAMYAAQREARS
jgi:hypothetical protein